MTNRSVIALFALLGWLLAASSPHTAHTEDVVCDPSVDTDNYYCRGWQDGVGKYGSRVNFIARMVGDEDGDDFGFEIVPLGDINGDSRDDFMVSVRNKCEWRIYLGDTLLSKTPYLTWPKSEPPYPCTPQVGRFFSTPDISGDGQPDLFRSRSSSLKRVDIYFAGSAFDTIPDVVIPDSDFVFPGGAGTSVAAGLDLNGDGEPDFALGDPNFLQESPKEHGRAYVFWGGLALDSIPDLIFTDTFWVGQNQPTAVGGALAMLSSVNGDLSAELCIGRSSDNQVTKDPVGRVDVFYGGPAMDTIRDVQFVGPDTSYYGSPCGYRPANGFGGVVEEVGDANQDGNRDLVVSGFSCVPGYLYFGGDAFDTLFDLRLTSPSPREEDGNIQYVIGLGDIDGDEFSDHCSILLADQTSGGWVRIHFSRPNPTGVTDWVIAGDHWFLASDNFGRSTTPLGDVNGDGFDDIAIGMETEQFAGGNSRGGVYIFAGYDPEIYSGVFDEPDAPLPSERRLIELIAPNPFNSATTIRLSDSFGAGTLTIYDILGRAVRAFNLSDVGVVRELHWDGRDARGASLASGMYFARATDGIKSETHKLVLLK